MPAQPDAKTAPAPPPPRSAPPPMPAAFKRSLGSPRDDGPPPKIDPALLATDADMAAFASSINDEPPAAAPSTPPGIDIPVIDAHGKVDATAKPEPKTEPAKPEPAKPEPAKPIATPDATAAPAATPDEELERLVNDSRAPKRLREEVKTQRASLHKLNQELARTRAELEAARTAPDSAKTLTEQLESIRKRADEAESKLAFTDYSQSEEFTTAYKRPYEAAVSEAYAGLKDIPGADGTPVTESQIQSLLMSGEREAYRLIDKIFDPADARLATRLVMDVYSKNRDMARKLDDSRARAAELKKTSDARRTEAELRYKTTYETAVKKLAEKDPETFDLETQDEERARLIADGYKYVDAVANPPKNLSVDQLAILHADVRHRAGIMPDLKFRLTKAQTRIKELEAELARFKTASPGKGEPRTSPGENAPEEGTLEAAFKTLADISDSG